MISIKKPKIGIIILSFERLSYLKKSVESVLCQTYQNLELVVIDDDSSSKAVENYLKKIHHLSKVRCFFNRSNLGNVKNFNKGIKLLSSDTKWALVLDNDDILAKDFVAQAVDFLLKNSQTKVICGRQIFIDKNKKILKKLDNFPLYESAEDYLIARCTGKREVRSSAIFFNLKQFKKIGGYPMFPSGIGTDTVFPFALGFDNVISYVPKAKVYIRIHPQAESESSANLKEKLTSLQLIKRYCLKVYKDNPKVKSFKKRQVLLDLESYVNFMCIALRFRKYRLLVKKYTYPVRLINILVKAIKGRIRLTGFGYCHSCGKYNFFYWHKAYEKILRKQVALWLVDKQYQEWMIRRENNFCSNCKSNFRTRIHAKTILKLFNFKKLSQFIDYLRRTPDFKIYETANYWIFRNYQIKQLKNYVVSEFHPDYPFGQKIGSIQNENLEQLTFKKGSFDLIITSEVLEHVIDLTKALKEIHRVLKKDGYHIFTIPVNNSLEKTVTRTSKSLQGKVRYLLPPIYHGDDISQKALVFKDFGRDVSKIVKRHSFSFRKINYPIDNKFLMFVYIAQKK